MNKSWYLKVLSFFSLLFSFGAQGKLPEGSQHVDLALKITQHVTKTMGPLYSHISFNMLDSGEPLTVLIVGPNKERNYYTLVTAGMSDHAMTTPTGAPSSSLRSELVMSLPSTWHPPKSEDDIAKMAINDKWPFALLLLLAEYPLKNHTWLGHGHTLPNKDFYYPKFDKLIIKGLEKDGGINYLGIYPITDAEYLFKKEHSADELFTLFTKNKVTLVFNPDRKSVAH